MPESGSDDDDDDESEESSDDGGEEKDGREWYEMQEALGEGSAGRSRGRQRLRYTPDEERTVVRKFDRKLVVFMAVLYLLSFLDRSSTSIPSPSSSHLH